MCASYRIAVSLKELGALFGAAVSAGGDAPELVVPFAHAPVVVEENGELQIRLWQFSLVPSWCKTPRPRFASYNAKLETAGEKPAWRGPFASQRCVAPLTSFIEASYWGELAGHMLSFVRSDGGILAAAAVYDCWSNPDSGAVVHSFALLTQPAEAFVEAHGHARQPVFLDERAWGEWMAAGRRSSAELRELLNCCEPHDLSVKIERPLKAGWEKRLAAQRHG